MSTRPRPVVKRTYGSRKPLTSSPARLNEGLQPEMADDTKLADTTPRKAQRTYGRAGTRERASAVSGTSCSPGGRPSASARSSSPGPASHPSTPPTSPPPATSRSQKIGEISEGPSRPTSGVPARTAPRKGDLLSFFQRQSPPKKRRRLSPPPLSPHETDQLARESPRRAGTTPDPSRATSSARGSTPSSSGMRRTASTPARLEQLYLDPFKEPGRATRSCPTCALSYSRSPVDMAFHAKHHKKVVNGCEWLSSDDVTGVTVVDAAAEWGKQRGGKILMVDYPVAEASVRRKLKDIFETIDTELSSTSLTPAQLAKSKAFLFVSAQRKVIACAVVQRIDVAFQAISVSADSEGPGPTASPSPDSSLVRFGEEDEGAIFCLPDPLPTTLGVQRIWTTITARRHGLASRLLDCVAARYIYGSPISMERRRIEVAFSQPTGKGQKLAKAWTGSDAIRVFVE